MKAKTINVQIVKNLGNYETIRLGGEWELNGETLQDAILAAVEELEQAWRKPAKPDAVHDAQECATTTVEEKTPQNEKKVENSRTIVRFKEESTLLQKIVRRLQNKKELTLADVEQYYELDEDAYKVIEAAIKLRGQ